MNKEEISNKIDEIAEQNGYELKNKDKIVRAKCMLFSKDGDLTRCPCDGNNPDRYCGSKQCMEDIAKDGHCHCRLFWRK